MFVLFSIILGWLRGGLAGRRVKGEESGRRLNSPFLQTLSLLNSGIIYMYVFLKFGMITSSLISLAPLNWLGYWYLTCSRLYCTVLGGTVVNLFFFNPFEESFSPAAELFQRLHSFGIL